MIPRISDFSSVSTHGDEEKHFELFILFRLFHIFIKLGNQVFEKF